eukprot:scaffold103438_cov55-Attheya_sp.AAC.1
MELHFLSFLAAASESVTSRPSNGWHNKCEYTPQCIMGMEEVLQTNCIVDIDIAVDVIGHAFVFHFDSTKMRATLST